jgi:PEP-CTERM motif
MKKNQFFWALAVTALTAVTVKAQYSNPFDATSSPFRFDFGTGVTANSVAWASGPTFDAGGNALSGSAKLSWTWNTAAADPNGNSAAFTADIIGSPGQSFVGGTLSFDLYLDSSSIPGSLNDYGFFQVVARNTDAYTFDDTGVGNGLNTFVTAPNQWTHFSVGLNATTGNLIRAITLQDYAGANRNIVGTQTIYIDNLQVTPAPEPSTIALAGLGIAGLFGIRRFRKN